MLQGLAGNDTLRGNESSDVLDGGVGVDRADFGSETGATGVLVNLGTTSFTTAGGVVIQGGTATDTFGSLDTLISIEDVRATSLADVVVGSDSANFLMGRSGDDVLVGRGGGDVLVGSAGNDVIDGTDVLNDSDPFDTAAFQFFDLSDSNVTQGVIANLSASSVTVGSVTVTTGTARDGTGATDTLIDIEILRGTQLADSFFGGNAANDFYEGFAGLGGDDTLNGGGGVDEARYTDDALAQKTPGVFGTSGVIVNLSATSQTASLAGTSYTVAAGTARDGYGDTDTLISIEWVRGTNFGDFFYGSSGDNVFRGFGGADRMDGAAGVDMADYSREWQTGNSGVLVNLSPNSQVINGFTVAGGTARDVSGATDTLISIEDVRGTAETTRSSVMRSSIASSAWAGTTCSAAAMARIRSTAATESIASPISAKSARVASRSICPVRPSP